MHKPLLISVVVPMFNEAGSVVALWKRLSATLDSLTDRWEVIVVNDGSSDDTRLTLESIMSPRLHVISFVGRSGQMAAIDAGYRRAEGDWVITMDGDLQHPPELIPDFIEKARREQIDIVFGQMTRRTDRLFLKRLLSKLYYPLIAHLTGTRLLVSAGDFRVVSRRVIDVIRQLPTGKHVFRVLLPNLGFPYGVVEFAAMERQSGESKYSFGRSFELALHSIEVVSPRLLQNIGLFASLTGVGSIATLIWIAASWLLGGTIPGWASTTFLMVLAASIQVMLLLLILHLVSGLAVKSNGAPAYIIDSGDEQTIGQDGVHERGNRADS